MTLVGNRRLGRARRTERAGLGKVALVAVLATSPAALVLAQTGLPAVGATLAGASTPAARAASNAGAATPVWHVSRAPKLRVDVDAGCPASVAAYQDVFNTFPGPPLVPPGPKAGLICRYGPSTIKAAPARLERQTRLGEVQADLLDNAVRRLNLAPPTGAMSCPADFGIVAVIGFSFPGRADVGLWYNAGGCQTLDNGRIGSFEGGNPSFYNGFLTTVNRLSPPVQS